MLTFDAAKHEYRFAGVVVPSVTQILRPMMDLDHVDADLLRRASDFGTAVHRACELHDLGQLDEDALDPELMPYLAGWKKFMSDCSCDWEWVERRMFHPTMRFAGTVDRIGKVNRDRAILDIKTGSSLMPSVGPQTAAYAFACEPVIGSSLKRYALRLYPGGYELKPYTDPVDWACFCSLLTLRSWCARNNVTPRFQ